MKITEGAKRQNAARKKDGEEARIAKEARLAEEKREDLFAALISGKDATEEVETSRGVFVVKYPKAKDLLAIGRLQAARRGGRPAEAFGAEAEMTNAVASALDVIVVSGPPWFEKARKENPDFSFLEAPGSAFLAELYSLAHSFREKVERQLGAAGGPGAGGVDAEAGADEAVDGGAFGELSGES